MKCIPVPFSFLILRFAHGVFWEAGNGSHHTSSLSLTTSMNLSPESLSLAPATPATVLLHACGVSWVLLWIQQTPPRLVR
uniref:Uncharacterized protein n=1 Tax=Anguilla anguilla TaxID=7936 RepID=A0A0E9W8K8_ANGAN